MEEIKRLPYRVRVKRAVEDWVEVVAETPDQAEQLAANLPHVISVFGKSAIRGDMVKRGNATPGVHED